MCAGDARISVSVATIEFASNGGGTALTVTEQGAYLDGIDGPQAPSLRREGVTEMLGNLHRLPGLPDRPIWRHSLARPSPTWVHITGHVPLQEILLRWDHLTATRAAL